MTEALSRTEAERLYTSIARIEDNQRHHNQKLTVILELLRRIQPEAK